MILYSSYSFVFIDNLAHLFGGGHLFFVKIKATTEAVAGVKELGNMEYYSVRIEPL